MGSILCEHCPAACCRYLAIEIDKPTSMRDFDDIRWYLMHEGISVFVEDGDWYLQIQARCKNIGVGNLCQAYETRPQICRDYKFGDCDYSETDHGYDHLFTHPQQIEEFYERKAGKRLGGQPSTASPTVGKRKKRRKKTGQST